MAVTSKRKRGPVSYREPSSDDDISGNSSDTEEETNRRKRAAPSRRSTRHHQEPLVQRPSPTTGRRRATASRVSRRGRRGKISYKDASTDDEDEDPEADFIASDDNGEPPPRTKPLKATTRPSGPRFPRPHQPTRSEGRSPRKKLVLGAPLKANEASRDVASTAPIPTDGHIPAWSTLPYHVLLQVFVYAAHPLRDENMKPMASVDSAVPEPTYLSYETDAQGLGAPSHHTSSRRI
jgi:hypothetical protein